MARLFANELSFNSPMEFKELNGVVSCEKVTLLTKKREIIKT
jgi:hypothetical protein